MFHGHYNMQVRYCLIYMCASSKPYILPKDDLGPTVQSKAKLKKLNRPVSTTLQQQFHLLFSSYEVFATESSFVSLKLIQLIEIYFVHQGLRIPNSLLFIWSA